MTNQYNFSDVFISYAREDTDFVQRLEAALVEQDYNVWVDWKDIPQTVDWWEEIEAGIDAATTFAFIISPDSAQSEVCQREVEYAVSQQKRIIPILYRGVDDHIDALHPAIQSHNWISFDETASSTQSFDDSVETLIEGFQLDYNYIQRHTRYLVRAKEWNHRDRETSFLLRGKDTLEADEWLSDADASRDPAPLPLQRDYIEASLRQWETDQQRQQQQQAIQIIDRRVLPAFFFGAIASTYHIWMIYDYNDILSARFLASFGRGFMFGILFAVLALFADELIQIRFPDEQNKRFLISSIYAFILANAMWFVQQIGLANLDTTKLLTNGLLSIAVASAFILHTTLHLKAWQAMLIEMGALSTVFIGFTLFWQPLVDAGFTIAFQINDLSQFLTIGIPMAILLGIGGFAHDLLARTDARESPEWSSLTLDHSEDAMS